MSTSPADLLPFLLRPFDKNNPTKKKSSSGGGASGLASVPPLSVKDLTYTEESKVRISASKVGEADAWEGDTLVLLAFQQDNKEAFAVIAGAGAAAVDEKLGGPALDVVVLEEFKVGRRREGGGAV